MHEESIRVPLIIKDPRLPATTHGRRTQMALNIDLAPTILAMAGLPIPAVMQGKNLQPLLLDPKVWVREDWYYEHVYTPAPSLAMGMSAFGSTLIATWPKACTRS